MKTTLTALAALLFAGAATAALAQDRDHDRGGGDRPQMHDRAPPSAIPAPPPMRPPSPAVAEGHARFGAPPPSGVPAASGAPAARPAPPAQPPFGGQRFSRENGGGPREGDHRFDRGGSVPPAAVPGTAGDRHWDRSHEVTPGVPDRGPDRTWDHSRDGRDPRDGRWDGRRDDHRDDHRDQHRDDHRDGRWDDHRDGRWDEHRDDHRDNRHFNPGRWERGRYPPVFWSPNRFHVSPYRAPYGFYARAWAFGDFLPRGWYAEPYWIGDFVDYDLPYPPPGFEWVRVGDDALMVDQYTGRIVQVVRGIFW